MKNKDKDSDKLKELRKRAEKTLEREKETVGEMSSEEVANLVHELRMHQIELEIQNDNLCRTQEELMNSRDRFSDLYDFAPVGYITISEKGMIIQANLTIANMLGLERGILIDQRFSRFIVKEDQDIFHKYRMELLETKEKLSCEVRLHGKNGILFWTHIESALETDIQIKVMQFRSVIVDITERKRAEEKLKEYSENLEKMVETRTQELRDKQEQLVKKEKLAVLGQLAGGVGHELRNPLSAIKNAAYFLNMAIEKPEAEVKESLEIIDAEVTTSDRIISSLLDFARTKPPTLHKVDINDIVRESVSRITIPENIKVVNQLDEVLPTTLADSEQLKQIFGNIISNAIQAMDKGGRVTIKSKMIKPEQIAISFTDTGVGIPKENLEKLFEPLFASKAKGIGLGLVIVKSLIEGHGGAIKVESKVGVGSTFTVNLPTFVKEGRNEL